MINTTPRWLQNAIDFINYKFPEDENVDVCLMYGVPYMIGLDGEHRADARYNGSLKVIYLIDYKTINEVMDYGNANTPEDITVLNLFHEYRHHQQLMNGEEFDEEDAEAFAFNMFQQFIIFEEALNNCTNSSFQELVNTDKTDDMFYE